MIVVAIIGILASVALPAYQDYTARSQMAEALSLASGAKTAVAEYYSNEGAWPADNATAGLDGTIGGKYVASVAVASNVITATMKATGVADGIKSATLALTATANGGAVEWACTSTADNKYLPTACR